MSVQLDRGDNEECSVHFTSVSIPAVPTYQRDTSGSIDVKGELCNVLIYIRIIFAIFDLLLRFGLYHLFLCTRTVDMSKSKTSYMYMLTFYCKMMYHSFRTSSYLHSTPHEVLPIAGWPKVISSGEDSFPWHSLIKTWSATSSQTLLQDLYHLQCQVRPCQG